LTEAISDLNSLKPVEDSEMTTTRLFNQRLQQAAEDDRKLAKPAVAKDDQTCSVAYCVPELHSVSLLNLPSSQNLLAGLLFDLARNR